MGTVAELPPGCDLKYDSQLITSARDYEFAGRTQGSAEACANDVYKFPDAVAMRYIGDWGVCAWYKDKSIPADRFLSNKGDTVCVFSERTNGGGDTSTTDSSDESGSGSGDSGSGDLGSGDSGSGDSGSGDSGSDMGSGSGDNDCVM